MHTCRVKDVLLAMATHQLLLGVFVRSCHSFMLGVWCWCELEPVVRCGDARFALQLSARPVLPENVIRCCCTRIWTNLSCTRSRIHAPLNRTRAARRTSCGAVVVVCLHAIESGTTCASSDHFGFFLPPRCGVPPVGAYDSCERIFALWWTRRDDACACAVWHVRHIIHLSHSCADALRRSVQQGGISIQLHAARALGVCKSTRIHKTFRTCFPVIFFCVGFFVVSVRVCR